MKITDLRQRLCNSVHGSRDLDADMFEAFGYEVTRAPVKLNGICWRYKPRFSRWLALPRVSTSIDDAIRFADSVARGSDIRLLRQAREWSAEIGWSDSHEHRTPAIAICLALLAFANGTTAEAPDGR